MLEILHKVKNIQKDINKMVDESIEIPMPIVEQKEQVIGNFPAIANKLQEELGSYLNRQKAAINKVLDATREKTEFLEELAEKTEESVKNEKRIITKAVGSL